MSILAVCTVIQCDGCKAVVVIKENAEYRNFDLTWHDGLHVDYCTDCRGKEQYRDAILADTAARQQLAHRVEGLVKKEESANVH